MFDKLRLNDWQSFIHNWQSNVYPEDALTPQIRFNRLEEEVEEARQEVRTFDGTPESGMRLASELGDMLIGTLGVLASIRVDAERVVGPKMETIYTKYNPTQNKKLREEGMEWGEAIAYQKREWNQRSLSRQVKRAA